MHRLLPKVRTVMMLLGALALPAGCVAPSSAHVTQDDATQVKGRIIGGGVAGGLPAVGELDGCTATLIGKRLAITAGHCVYNKSASALRFNLGTYSNTPDYSLPVVAINLHPNFSYAALDNDVALVTLGVDAPVAPVTLVDHIDASWVGRSLTFIGFGVSNGDTRSGQGIKRAVTLPITAVNTTRIVFGDASKNICYGDSGGPSIYTDATGQQFLVSITSYTVNTNCSGKSDATRVDVFQNFIGVTPGTPATSVAPQASTQGCGAETFAGRCSGNAVVYCDNDTVVKQDCSQSQASCGWSYEKQYFGCVLDSANGNISADAGGGVTPGTTGAGATTTTGTTTGSSSTGTVDPCNGESFAGRCENNISIWCYKQTQIIRDDCGAKGFVCQYNTATGYNDCMGASLLE